MPNQIHHFPSLPSEHIPILYAHVDSDDIQWRCVYSDRVWFDHRLLYLRLHQKD